MSGEFLKPTLQDEAEGFWARQSDRTIRIVTYAHIFIFVALQFTEAIPVIGDLLDTFTLYVGHELVQLMLFIPVEIERRKRRDQKK